MTADIWMTPAPITAARANILDGNVGRRGVQRQQVLTGTGAWMTSSGHTRFAHIDAMRALAIMLVVVAHAGLTVVPGGSGVTIFFSISGFIIAYLLLRERDRTGRFRIKDFYLRRVLKIGPPLLVCVILPTIVLGIVRSIDWAPLVGIVFFYYNWFKAAQGADAPLPGSGVVWSLSIEEQFYLAFAAIWLVAVWSHVRMRWLAIAAGIAAAASLTSRILLASGSEAATDRIYYGSDTRLDGIALGVATAIAFHSSELRPGRVRSIVRWCMRDSAVVAAITLYLISLIIRDQWFRETFRFTFQSVSTCIVLIYGFGSGSSRLRTWFDAIARSRLVQFTGLSSYSIYLIHLTTMYYTYNLMNEFPGAVRISALTALATGSGMLIYLAVERPVQRLRDRRTALPRAGRP
jgi:peptidoglycan/LPS O-acetylase OafA/YrhL